MTEVDASIPLSIKPPQFDDPQTIQAKALQLSQLGLANQGAQQDYQDRQTLRSLYAKNSGANGLDLPGLQRDLGAAGLGQQGFALQQQQLANTKTQADIGETNAKAGQATAATATDQYGLHLKKLDYVGGQLSALQQGSIDPQTGQRIPATAQDVTDAIHRAVDGGYVDSATGAQMVRSIPGNPSMMPAFLARQLAETQSAAQQLQMAKDRAPTLEKIDTGSGTMLANRDPLSGAITQGPTVAKGVSADTAATNATHLSIAANRVSASGFTPDQGDLLGAFAQAGVSLPSGLRSKAQMQSTVQSLLDRNPGKSPDEIAQLVASGQINFNSDKKSATVAAGQEGKVSTAVNELSTFGDQALDASAKVPRGSFVPATKLLQMADSSISDPNLLTLKLKLNALNNAYNVLSARGGTDAGSRAHVQQLFSSANSPEGVAALVKGLKEEGAGAKSSAAQAAHVGSAPPAAAAPSGAVPPDIAAILAKHGGQ
jgi:hypothetical protein